MVFNNITSNHVSLSNFKNSILLSLFNIYIPLIFYILINTLILLRTHLKYLIFIKLIKYVKNCKRICPIKFLQQNRQ